MSDPQKAPGVLGTSKPILSASPANDQSGSTTGRAPETPAAQLLRLEAMLRQVRSFPELTYFIANELRPLTRAQQVFVASSNGRGRFKIEAVSSLTNVDRASPMIDGFARLLEGLARDHDLSAPAEFDLATLRSPQIDLAKSYPLPSLLWIPFEDFNGGVIGGMLHTRTAPWSQPEMTIASHLGGTCALAWMALKPAQRHPWLAKLGLSRLAMAGCAALVLLGLLPVSMTALAPAEVAPRGAYIVTAGVDGVVEQINVDPNTAIRKGDVLVQLADTALKNGLEVAEREVAVAEANRKKASQLAFVDVRGRHDLVAAQSELDVKIAERDYARDMLARTRITAERDGIAFFSDKKDLIGKPVGAGEKLLEIVDPAALEFHVDLPVADAIVLNDGARVKVFLDSDPLHPIEATLKRSDYRARPHDNQQLSFRLIAEADPAATPSLRLGVRGTAQVYGERTRLWYYLLRRPISALRQAIGL